MSVQETGETRSQRDKTTGERFLYRRTQFVEVLGSQSPTRPATTNLTLRTLNVSVFLPSGRKVPPPHPHPLTPSSSHPTIPIRSGRVRPDLDVSGDPEERSGTSTVLDHERSPGTETACDGRGVRPRHGTSRAGHETPGVQDTTGVSDGRRTPPSRLTHPWYKNDTEKREVK